jgi:hypothetical protein
MANDDVSKPPSADAAAAPMNKAQAEFQRYMQRIHAQQPGGPPGFLMPVGLTPGSDAMPAWAVPPSVAMLPHAPGAPGFLMPMPPAGGAGNGSLAGGLGSTFRLGVDLINAALAGGVRLLNGISGTAHGYGQQECGHEGCGCEACRRGCGESDCCGYDCCGGCDECCRPSVGTCC